MRDMHVMCNSLHTCKWAEESGRLNGNIQRKVKYRCDNLSQVATTITTTPLITGSTGFGVGGDSNEMVGRGKARGRLRPPAIG